MLFAVSLGDVAAVRFSSLRLQGAAAGYQVTAGKTLILTRVLYLVDTGGPGFSFGYSDSDRGMANAADGANPVNLDSVLANGLSNFRQTVATVLQDVNTYYEIPAGKYPRLVQPVGVATLFLQFFGHEV